MGWKHKRNASLIVISFGLFFDKGQRWTAVPLRNRGVVGDTEYTLREFHEKLRDLLISMGWRWSRLTISTTSR